MAVMLSGAMCRPYALAAVSTAAICPDFRRICALSPFRHADLHQRIFVTHAPALSVSARRCGSKRSRVTPRAAPQDANGADTSGEFNLSEYVEAKVERVQSNSEERREAKSLVLLKILDGTGRVLPVFVGEHEGSVLQIELQRQSFNRPLTHDLMKNSWEMLGYRVSKVRITCLLNNTYYSRIHLVSSRREADGTYNEMDFDARPSDAINIATRFAAPIYINKQLADRMAADADQYRVATAQTTHEIIRSCKDVLMHFPDPIVVDKLHLQLAITEERYDDARVLKDRIEEVLKTDRTMRLMVQLEAALHDSRIEEAAQLRDELALEYEKRAEAAGRERQQLDL